MGVRRLVAWLGLAVVPVFATAQGEAWRVPRTPDGQPDLQGVWTNATITPFERPTEFADKPVPHGGGSGRVRGARRRRPHGRAASSGRRRQLQSSSGSTKARASSGRDATSLVVDPPDGRVPVRPEAEAKRDYDLAHVADSYEHMSLWDRCITRGVPAGMFPAGYNNAYQIVQMPGLRRDHATK